MTVTRPVPGPLGEPTPDGPGLETIAAAQIDRFHHPATRTLLASEGLTTTALERILDTDLSVRVLRQDEIAARRLPAFVTDGLRLRTADRTLIRRSYLVTPDLTTVSVNYVVAVAQPAAANGLDDLRTPIGHGLVTRGLTQRRRVVWAGITTWPDGRPCAAKAYLMMLGDRPVCYIREAFAPAVVPPEHTAVSLPEPDLRDEPEPASTRSAAMPDRSDDATCPLPQRILPEDCAELTTELARAARGQSFVLHLDGAASDAPDDDAGMALLYAVAAVFAHVADVPVTAIDAIGQTAAAAPVDHSAELLRRIASRLRNARIATMLADVAGLLPTAATAPPDSRELFSAVPRRYISRVTPAAAIGPSAHRHLSRPRLGWDRSAHQLWVPSRIPDAATTFAARVDNPLAVRLDPATTPRTVESLCLRLNPERRPGRLSLVAPPGLGSARQAALLAAAADSGAPVCWMCAPIRSAGAASDIRTFFRTCKEVGNLPAGMTFPGLDPEWALRCALAVSSEMHTA